MNNAQRKTAADLCRLLGCALSGEKPQWERMDLPEVFALAKKQMLAAAAYEALEAAGAMLESSLQKAWQRQRNGAVRHSLLLAAERRSILEELDSRGIWHLCMKGAELADLYPKVGMRPMGDVDILIDPARRREIRDMMQARGYTVAHYGGLAHDVYMKKPGYCVEMHNLLFDESVPAPIAEYYSDIRGRLVPGQGMELRFRAEDFYCYYIAHGYKHFTYAGIGLRFLLDIYVYTEKKQLDWDAVFCGLRQLELLEFEELLRTTAQKIFGGGVPLTDAQEACLAHCVGSGVFGTGEQAVANQIRQLQSEGNLGRSVRMQYCLRRIWPDMRWFRRNHPFFARWWPLQPFFVVWRVLRKLLTGWKHILRELNLVKKSTR